MNYNVVKQLKEKGYNSKALPTSMNKQNQDRVSGLAPSSYNDTYGWVVPKYKV
jgi:hypothetical protein